MSNKIIVIVGPTAVGKTYVSVELAKKLNTEIISADSMQIYKSLDYGTAKVTKDEQLEIKHHLIDICDISEEFSVADFKSLCYDKIDEILKKNKIPIIVGGTGLYINSVVLDLDFQAEEEKEEVKEYRNYLYDLASKNSNGYIYDILVKLDPVTASQIHKNNLRRVVRALEIIKFNGNTKSEHMENEKRRIENLNLKYDFSIYYIDMPREILYDRINRRVDQMLEQGEILKEAKLIFDMGNKASSTCKQAIGYKEFFPYFNNEETLDVCVQKLKQATRNYAKRQITWFKNKLDKVNLNGLLDIKENVEIVIKNNK